MIRSKENIFYLTTEQKREKTDHTTSKSNSSEGTYWAEHLFMNLSVPYYEYYLCVHIVVLARLYANNHEQEGRQP